MLAKKCYIERKPKTPPQWQFDSKPNREQQPGKRRLFKTEDRSQVSVTQLMSNT